MPLLAAVLLAGVARADEKDLYAFVGYEVGLSHYNVPASGSATATTYAGALDLSVYYGLTNAFYAGARVRASSSSDVHFSSVKLDMQDGTQSFGDVYDDHRSLGLGALLLYRFDTGYALAPLLELEAGFTAHQYRSVIHVPTGVAYTVPLADTSETLVYGAAGLLLEYRLANRWIAATGVEVRAANGGLNPWAVSVPLRLGYVW